MDKKYSRVHRSCYKPHRCCPWYAGCHLTCCLLPSQVHNCSAIHRHQVQLIDMLGWIIKYFLFFILNWNNGISWIMKSRKKLGTAVIDSFLLEGHSNLAMYCKFLEEELLVSLWRKWHLHHTLYSLYSCFIFEIYMFVPPWTLGNLYFVNIRM